MPVVVVGGGAVSETVEVTWNMNANNLCGVVNAQKIGMGYYVVTNNVVRSSVKEASLGAISMSPNLLSVGRQHVETRTVPACPYWE
jgi:hypothetical protein